MAGDGHGAVLSNWKSACYIRLIMLFKDLLTISHGLWILVHEHDEVVSTIVGDEAMGQEGRPA